MRAAVQPVHGRAGGGRRWTVVDFKSGFVSDAQARARYGQQVALYCRALAQITLLPARGYLYLVDRSRAVEVPAEEVEDAG